MIAPRFHWGFLRSAQGTWLALLHGHGNTSDPADSGRRGRCDSRTDLSRPRRRRHAGDHHGLSSRPRAATVRGGDARDHRALRRRHDARPAAGARADLRPSRPGSPRRTGPAPWSITSALDDTLTVSLDGIDSPPVPILIVDPQDLQPLPVVVIGRARPRRVRSVDHDQQHDEHLDDDHDGKPTSTTDDHRRPRPRRPPPRCPSRRTRPATSASTTGCSTGSGSRTTSSSTRAAAPGSLRGRGVPASVLPGRGRRDAVVGLRRHPGRRGLLPDHADRPQSRASSTTASSRSRTPIPTSTARCSRSTAVPTSSASTTRTRRRRPTRARSSG